MRFAHLSLSKAASVALLLCSLASAIPAPQGGSGGCTTDGQSMTCCDENNNCCNACTAPAGSWCATRFPLDADQKGLFCKDAPPPPPQTTTATKISDGHDPRTFTMPPALSTATTELYEDGTWIATPTHSAAALVLPTPGNNPKAFTIPEWKRQVWYGQKNVDNSLFVAGVDLKGNSTHPLVNFDDVISSLASKPVCSSSSIGLTFKTDDFAEHIAASWKKSFVLITNGGEHCGALDGKKHFFSVSSITRSSANKKAFTLNAKEIAGGAAEAVAEMDINWGNYAKPSKQVKRGGPTGPVDALSQLWDLIMGVSAESSNTAHYSVTPLGFIQALLSGWVLDTVNSKLIQCHDCGLWTDLTMTGRAALSFKKLTECSVELSLKNTRLNYNFEASMDEGVTVSKKFTLARYIPIGIVVPGIITVAPIFSLNGQISAKVYSNLAIDDLGFKASLPDSTLKIDVLNKPSYSGFGNPTFELLTPKFGGMGYHATSIDLNAWIGPAFSLNFTVGDSVSAGAMVELQFPGISVNMRDDPNKCGKGNDYNFGTQAKIGVTCDLVGSVNAKAGIIKVGTEEKFFSRTWNDVANKCINYGAI